MPGKRSSGTAASGGSTDRSDVLTLRLESYTPDFAYVYF